ncbi:hypothetical protein [Microbispora sp. ATCC PTA-5024]|uniref:hypothetical protein n=1 Tax=Microbispora sp. ATCC PTA-5024 TaxID=316330 RepID=UPI0003DCF632|nr:hypothetical protein [Microbispora sp. ATCC PTA-5024]ETK35867.1 hypothetical protein MPTA5024_12010 [Microbispora sp. ATCC PTA-5024]
MGSTRTRVHAVLLVAALAWAALLGCDPSEEDADGGASTPVAAMSSAAAGGEQGSEGDSPSGGGQGGGAAGGGGGRPGRYTLTSGPTLDGDFSAPQGNSPGTLCLTLSAESLGTARVVRLHLAEDVPGVFTLGSGAVLCPAPGPVASPCEGSVLAPGGPVCLLMFYGRGDADSAARLEVTLEQRCTGRDTPACESLPDEAAPSESEPVTVTWGYSVTLYYCAGGYTPGVSSEPCDTAATPPPSTDPVAPDPAIAPTPTGSGGG